VSEEGNVTPTKFYPSEPRSEQVQKVVVSNAGRLRASATVEARRTRRISTIIVAIEDHRFVLVRRDGS